MVVARRLIILTAAAVTFAAVLAGPASAQAVTCGQVITQSTQLDSDLVCDDPLPDGSRSDGVVIGASGITLDLNGHKVFADHFAIRNEGYDDVVIRNGTVGGDFEGVHLVDAERNKLRNLTLISPIWAVRGSGANGTLVTASRFTAGLLGLGGNGIVIRDNVVTGGMTEISVGGDDNTIVHNTLSGQDSGAIGVSGSRNRIAWNTITGVLMEPIVLYQANDGVVAHNSIEGYHYPGWCAGPGLRLEQASGNLVRDNSVSYQRTAMRVVSGDRNVFLRNRVSSRDCPEAGTENDGFRIEAAATDTLLQGNVASDMNDDGIDVEAPGTRVRRNTANDNGDLGVEAVPGVIDLGGNRASGNGNPVQCLNVVCR